MSEKKVLLEYEYKNRQSSPVSVWMAIPPNTTTQRVLSVQFQSTPEETNELFSQTVGFYHLAAGESINVNVELALFPTKLKKEKGNIAPLPAEERKFYLRSTYLCPVNEALRAEAEEISGLAKDQLSIVKCIFEHLHKTYRYKFPPEKRGALHFKEAGKGDCGEFSFLFCSYMRSLGIPCRTVVGAFLHRFNPHVWNEVWLDSYGWIPVDTSMAATLKNPFNHLALPIQMGERTNKNHYFGNFDGKRVIFSLDADWPLKPEYEDAEPPKPRQRFVFGKEIAYGFQSLDGAAPYLQPIYTRFTENPAPEKITDLLGKWNIKEQSLFMNRLSYVKKYSFRVFFAAMFTGIIGDLARIALLNELPIVEIGYIAAAIGLLATILRKEANRLILVLFVLTFTFSLLLIM